MHPYVNSNLICERIPSNVGGVLDMSKQSAVIVGVGPGIGLSVAKAFGKQGYRVILVSRNEQSLQQLVGELLAANIEAYAIQGDAGIRNP